MSSEVRVYNTIYVQKELGIGNIKENIARKRKTRCAIENSLLAVQFLSIGLDPNRYI